MAPAYLTSYTLACHAAIADYRVPVAVRLFLIFRCDLKGKRLAVLERRAAIETKTGNANNRELHRQDVARLAARIVAGRLVNGGYFAIRESGGVESRRLKRVLFRSEERRVGKWCSYQ